MLDWLFTFNNSILVGYCFYTWKMKTINYARKLLYILVWNWMPHWAKANHNCCIQMSDRLTGTPFLADICHPPNCQWPHLAIFFPSAKCFRSTQTIFCSHSLSHGLDQQEASEMYRDPRWSDISWYIKQAHKWVKERFITHDQNATLQKKPHFVFVFFLQKISWCLWSVCWKRTWTSSREDSESKRKMYPHAYSQCIYLAIWNLMDYILVFLHQIDRQEIIKTTEPDRLINWDDFHCFFHWDLMEMPWPRGFQKWDATRLQIASCSFPGPQ